MRSQNLWLYLIELEIPLALVLVGLPLGFYKIFSRPIPWLRAIVAVIFLTALFVGNARFFWGRFIPSQAARLYESPISGIQCIEIKPGRLNSLVNHDVNVTSPETITAIMTAIRSARPCLPNHPESRWECFLVVSNASGASYVEIQETIPGPIPQGTILDCELKPSGDIYDTLCSATLGQILERTVGK